MNSDGSDDVSCVHRSFFFLVWYNFVFDGSDGSDGDGFHSDDIVLLGPSTIVIVNFGASFVENSKSRIKRRLPLAYYLTRTVVANVLHAMSHL